MDLISKNVKEETLESDALILPLFEGEGIGPYSDLDKMVKNLPSDIIKRGVFKGRAKDLYLIHTLENMGPGTILLLGLGKKGEINREKIRQAGGRAAGFLKKAGMRDAALSTRNISSVPDILSFVEGALLSQYGFGIYKKEDEKSIKSLTILSSDNLNTALERTAVIADAVNFARDLVNTPSNDMTPCILLHAASSLKDKRISVKALNRDEAEKLGMGAYFSVAKGSAQPPQFIIVHYKGSDSPCTALIGKSITFDSGGISIKPSDGMEKMKYDMAGGAAVLGVIKAASALDLPLNIVGILPATENMPGGSATRPGDVVRTLEGKTVEVINTDAEGRLVLADGIGYAKKFEEPKEIIDIATLTGACSIALGNEAMAMMSNNEKLISRMKKASEESGERVWPMPLYDEYKEYLESDIADMKNSGGRVGSLVTAAYFLKEFAGDTPWVHLDIACTAWADKEKPYTPKGATGTGVRLLLDFLAQRDGDET